MSKQGICYLIHFDKPFKHARHYIGYTAIGLDNRIARHKSGDGAALLKAVNNVGIQWNVVRTWIGDRQTEIELKKRKNASKLCPVCNPKLKGDNND